MTTPGSSLKTPDTDHVALHKAELENRLLEIQIAAAKRGPGRWDVVKTMVPWAGILVPVLISLFAFFHQRGIELQQKGIELRDQRNKEMAAATEMMNRGDRSSGVLLLSIYGEDAIPIIVGEVRIHNFHVDWPSSTLAALTSLKRIGVDKMKPTDVEFLKLQMRVAIEELRSQNVSHPDSKIALGQIQIVNAIEDLLGHEPLADAELAELKKVLVDSRHKNLQADKRHKIVRH